MDLKKLKLTDEPDEPAPDSEQERSVVSRRLRDVRIAKGYTVSELAAKSSVSAGMISQIERGISNPSVKTLERLRVALDIALTDFFSDKKAPAEERSGMPHEDNFVRRREARPKFAVRASGLLKELLTPEGEHELQFMLIHFEPGASSMDVLMGAGEKAGMVLSGELQLTVGDLVSSIREGDSFQFNSAFAHRVQNLGPDAAKVIWFMDTRRPRLEM